MVQTASLTGVLQVILILLIVSYIIRLLTPYFLKLLLRRVEKKVRARFEGFTGAESTENDNVSNKKKSSASKKSNSIVGDYIEFEEID